MHHSYTPVSLCMDSKNCATQPSAGAITNFIAGPLGARLKRLRNRKEKHQIKTTFANKNN